MIGRFSATLLVALIGGVSFYFLPIPLPWLLGPMTAIIIWTFIFGGVTYWPVGLRNAGLMLLGYMMGRPFTVETARRIITEFPEMALMTVLTVLFSLLLSYLTYRQMGISLASCVIGGIPGGLSQMVVLGEEIPAADGTIVALMQTLRMLAVVFSVPFLALHGLAKGAASAVVSAMPAITDPLSIAEMMLQFTAAVLIGTWLAVRIKLPTPYLLGPVLATCLLVLNGSPPPMLPGSVIIAAQVSIGIYIGTTVKLNNLELQWRTILPYALLNAVVVILFSLSLGWLLTCIISVNLVTGFLSTAPGGMAEMSLTAMLVNADLSTVVTYQICRVFFILLVMPFILKRWLSNKT
jgi:membrane AbrB-like protein